jgi:hypothetical protein
MKPIPKLYHGTSFNLAGKIFKQGICPRGNRQGNWDETYPSLGDRVYLSTAYPFYFAVQAVFGNEECFVLEIDPMKLDHRLMYPDEDFIAQAYNNVANHTTYRDDLETYRNAWQLSIQHLGNCCYKGTVPKRAITRSCRVDFSKRKDLLLSIMDPTISIMNYKFCEHKYRGMVAWFFGDEALLPQVEQAKIYPDEIRDQQKELWNKVSRNRDGIVVTNLKG